MRQIPLLALFTVLRLEVLRMGLIAFMLKHCLVYSASRDSYNRLDLEPEESM